MSRFILKLRERAFIKLRNEQKRGKSRYAHSRNSMYDDYVESNEFYSPFLICEECNKILEKNYFRDFEYGYIRKDVILCKKCSNDAEDDHADLMERIMWDSDFD
jgi:hypothetical protein